MTNDRLRVVAENSEGEIRHAAALEELEWSLKELSTNILRLMAGGGKEWLLAEQMVRCLHAFVEHSEAEKAIGRYCTSSWRSWWEYRVEGTDADLKRWSENGEIDFYLAQDAICRSAMRVVASRLAGLKMHEARAEHSLFDALKSLEQARETSRRYYRRPAR